jgi:hypothetical protein
MILPSPNGQDFKVLQISGPDGSIKVDQIGDPIPGVFNRFGPDEKTVFVTQNSTTQNGVPQTRVWSLDPAERGEAIQQLPWEMIKITSDGNFAILREYQADKSKSIFHLWNLEQNKESRAPIDSILDYYPPISPNGGFLVGGTGKGEFTVWNVATGKSFSIPGTFSGFTFDDKYVLARDSSGDSSSLWDTSTEKMIFPGLKGSFWGSYGPDNKLLVFRDSEAGSFMFFDPENKTLIGPTSKADSIVFSPSGEYFVISLKGTISLSRIDSVEHKTDLATSSQLVGFSEDGKTVVTTTTNQGKTEISIWSTESNKPPIDTFTYEGSLNSIRFAQNGKLLVLFGNQGLYVWDLLNPGTTLPRIADSGGSINRMVFSSDSSKLATIGNDGVIVWSVATQNPLTPLLPGKIGRIIDVAFDGNSIILLNADGSVDRSQISEAASEPTHIGSAIPNACKMILSPDGKRIAYISGKNKLHIVSVDGSNPYQLPNKDVFCYGPLAFSGNGAALAFTERDRVYVSLIEDNGQLDTPKEVAENPVFDLTFILDDTLLAANTGDGRILVWDVNERTQLASFNQSGIVKRSNNGIMQIYLPQERRLINLDFNKEAWHDSLKQWQEDLCEKAGRVLDEDEWQQYFDSAYPDTQSCPMPPPPPSE